MAAIMVENLTKKFGAFCAVDGLSFSVDEGEIFGFLGPNGAGKTTTIKILSGILPPSSGSGRVAGFSLWRERKKIKKNIGYMSQRFSLYPDLTVDENINFFGGVYGLKREEIARRKKWILEMADLTQKTGTLTGQLSTGYKQRLALGCAMIHRPKIVFLDEPTSGVDPISRRNFWQLIYRMSHEEKVTALVTTHYLDEAEYCHRLLLIYAGKIVAEDSPRGLKEKHQGRPLEEVFIRLIREKEKE